MRIALVVGIALALQPANPLTLRIRVFDGATEVTNETRVNVYKAGERQNAIAEARGRAIIETSVSQGMYDAQAIHERDGRVIAIRWAERLIVMPYPDEGGQHLEVINFQNGFGAIEVRSHTPGPLDVDVAIFAAGSRQQEAARRIDGVTYSLFVVPAGHYDLRVRRGGQTSWHPDIEVPSDRTRLWIAPQQETKTDGAGGAARLVGQKAGAERSRPARPRAGRESDLPRHASKTRATIESVTERQSSRACDLQKHNSASGMPRQVTDAATAERR